jgi:hypothetical protein
MKSTQLVEQSLGILEVSGVEPFGKPAVDGGEQVMGLGASALVAPEAREAGGGAQLQGLRLLALGCIDRLVEPRCCFGSVARLGQDSPPQPVELRLIVALASSRGSCGRPIQRRKRVVEPTGLGAGFRRETKSRQTYA